MKIYNNLWKIKARECISEGLSFTLTPRGNISEARTWLGELKLGALLGMLHAREHRGASGLAIQDQLPNEVGCMQHRLLKISHKVKNVHPFHCKHFLTCKYSEMIRMLLYSPMCINSMRKYPEKPIRFNFYKVLKYCSDEVLGIKNINKY